MDTNSQPRLALSRCLLGAAVRYDGRHKLQQWLAEMDNENMELLAVCPEVEAGLGVPREPIALYRIGEAEHLLGVTSRMDHSAAMDVVIAARLGEFFAEGIDGYVFQARSPSCGVTAVPVFGTGGAVVAEGPGRFAAAVLHAFPDLPVAEAQYLDDRACRADFLQRVRVHRRGRTEPLHF